MKLYKLYIYVPRGIDNVYVFPYMIFGSVYNLYAVVAFQIARGDLLHLIGHSKVLSTLQPN